MSNSQASQDTFVILLTNGKKNGWYVEIGSNDPIYINNTYLLEKEYQWKGLMVEWDKNYFPAYQTHRPMAFPLLGDATQLDYRHYLETHHFPYDIDYLQIDLEVENRSTLTALEILDKTVFGPYTFGVVTFEHDIYRADYHNTRILSRAIFEKNGYQRIFSNVSDFEDWYAHPKLIDNTLLDNIMRHPDNKEGIHHKECIRIIESLKNTAG